MTKPEITRMSLAQHFAAPGDYMGEFGWLCGYAADEAFLGIAAERFSNENASARAASGCLRLGVMLDPAHPQLTPAAIPGVLHFPVKRSNLPFALLHAKVAVLGFRHLDRPNDWQLRVLVSTGNWTRATLDSNIDLAWRLDIDSGALGSANAADCADLAAVWKMLAWLRGMFDTSILDAVPAGRSDTETQSAWQNLERWVKQASTHAAGVPRYIDNRRMSLWAQVQENLKTMKRVRRNYLAMGSAFYQGAGGAQLPSVLNTVVTDLQEGLQLISNPEVDIYVNPQACQAVAVGAPAIAAMNWTIRPPRMPRGQTFMHAKFIFSANARDDSNHCASPWLYFGSGNLTGPGFLKKASAKGGNLEAGVVLEPDHLVWYQTGDDDPAHVIGNLLPLQWRQEATTAGALQEGEDMAIHDAQFVAPPLAWLMWTGDGAHAGWLTTPATTGAAFDLLDTSAAPCVRDGTERIRWNGARPVQVALRWVVDGKVHSAQVPVIDEHGGIAAAPARVLSLEQASWELLNFPARPAEDDPGIIDCPGMPDEQCDDSLAQAGRKSALQYPIRLMMQQLDTIADIQCNVDRLDWRMWCNRLEQVWCRASNSAGVTAFRTLGIDPLSAMLAPAFRPVYAESAGSVEGQRYEATLARIAVAWKVNDLANLGHDA